MRFPRHALVFAAACAVALPGVASAYIGPSFLRVPGIDGGWKGAPYRHWIRANSNYWSSSPSRISLTLSETFPGPQAPRQGGGSLMVAIDKHSPALDRLMRSCRDKTAIPEIGYAESSERCFLLQLFHFSAVTAMLSVHR